MKIHCLEMKKESFNKVTPKELAEMVGWINYDVKNDVWDVTMSDGCGFECKDQATAQIIASIEEVKALLMKGEDK